MKMLADLSYDSCSAYTFSDYIVWVIREENEVRLTVQNKSQCEGVPSGGSIWLAPEIARRLGHALTLLSSPEATESELERIKIICQDQSLAL